MKDFALRAAAQLKSAFLSLTHPDSVRTNQDTGLIRLLACLCMLIDHSGKMLFPQYPVMRIIGRLAFPLFAYGIAVGAVYTRNPAKYLSRIVLLALVSQPLYAVGLDHETRAMYAIPFAEQPVHAAVQFYLNSWYKPSILFALSLGLLLILCLRSRHFALALGVYVLCLRLGGALDYGINGIHLMLLFYLLCEHPLACFAGVSSYIVWWALKGSGYAFFGQSFSMQIFSLPAAVLACLPQPRRLRLPKWFVYGFYPAHLAALILLCR